MSDRVSTRYANRASTRIAIRAVVHSGKPDRTKHRLVESTKARKAENQSLRDFVLSGNPDWH
jgi:hypothetical protein